MTVRQIAYRLKSEGKAEVLRDAREVGQGLKDSYAAAEQGATSATAAAERLERKYWAMAQAAKASADAQATQQRFDALLGVRNAPIPSARESASAFILDDEQGRRAQQLRDALDPAAAAQSRLNNELKEYQTLATAGKITTAELASLQAQARTRFDETTAAIQRSERGLSRLAVASRLNLARQGADVFVTAAMGMNPAMIAIQQGPQILEAMATSGIKANAALLAIGGTLTAAAAGVVVLGAAWARAEDAAASYTDMTTGVGRTAGLTADQLRDLTVAAAENGEISRKAARGLAAEYLATGQIGGQVLGDLITLTRDYASFTGDDAEGATKALAKAMLDPKAAANDLTLQFGLLNQEQIANIENLVEQGDLLGAQRALLDELSNSVRGHADRAREITDVWNAIGRSISDALDKLGEFLHTTEDERLGKLQRQLAFVMEAERRGNPNDNRREDIERQIRIEQTRRSMVALVEGGQSSEAAQNQQDEREQRARERREREARAAASRARSEASRAAREAERAERQALQRTRRDEDVQMRLDIEAARSRNAFDEVQKLEDANAVRQRERQLIDDEVAAEEAKSRALAEQQRIIEARTIVQEREVRAIADGVDLEASRIDGLNAFVFRKEREAEIEDRILQYRKQGKDEITATNMALSDQAVIDQARATAAQQVADAREREWKMVLAQASGNRTAMRGLDREDFIARRSAEIEAAEHWNRGDRRAAEQAAKEYGELMRAETTGAFRDGVKGLASDVRRSGLGNALGDEFDQATDRLIDKMIDWAIDTDWTALFGGAGNWFGNFSNFLFGRNAEGTDYWTGEPTWVGERGPELLIPPRGSRIVEHARSLDMMRRAAGGGAQQPVLIEVRAVKGDAFEPEVVRISGRVVQQGMASAYGQSVDTSMKAAPTAVADARAYKG